MAKRSLVYTVLALICLNLLTDASALPSYTFNDRMVDNLILEAISGKDGPAWYQEQNRAASHTHKRNSEIINSLLGIPKVINDAGRK